jgi:hypothetical protein
MPATATKKSTEMTKNAQAVRTIAKVISVIILVLGVIYAETMYLSVVEKSFPEGFLRVFAMAGAIVGGLSVLLLLLAKSYWFTEGLQLVFAYCFTGVEVLLMVLNILVAFDTVGGAAKDSWLQIVNQYVSPATPVIAIIGWTIIWSLDASSKRRHAQANLEEEQADAEQEYSRDVALAGLNLRKKFLTVVTSNMEEELQSAHVRRQAQIAASQMAAEALSEVVGMPVAPRIGREELQALPAGMEQKLEEVAAGGKPEEAANTVGVDPAKTVDSNPPKTEESNNPPKAEEPGQGEAKQRQIFTRQEVVAGLLEKGFDDEQINKFSPDQLLLAARILDVIPENGAIITPEPERQPLPKEPAKGYTAKELVAEASKIMPPVQVATLGMYPPEAILSLLKKHGMVGPDAYYDDGKARVAVSEVSNEAEPVKKKRARAKKESQGEGTTKQP